MILEDGEWAKAERVDKTVVARVVVCRQVEWKTDKEYHSKADFSSRSLIP